MTASTLHDLAVTEPGMYAAACIILGAALGIALTVICLAWGPPPQQPVTRPVSSARKAPRGRA